MVPRSEMLRLCFFSNIAKQTKSWERNFQVTILVNSLRVWNSIRGLYECTTSCCMRLQNCSMINGYMEFDLFIFTCTSGKMGMAGLEILLAHIWRHSLPSVAPLLPLSLPSKQPWVAPRWENKKSPTARLFCLFFPLFAMTPVSNVGVDLNLVRERVRWLFYKRNTRESCSGIPPKPAKFCC